LWRQPRLLFSGRPADNCFLCVVSPSGTPAQHDTSFVFLCIFIKIKSQKPERHERKNVWKSAKAKVDAQPAAETTRARSTRA
jgi:hypothetical protein